MSEGENIESKKEEEKVAVNRRSFIVIVLLVTLVAVLAFIYLSLSYKNNFEAIVSVQKQDHQQTEEILDKVHNRSLYKNDNFFNELESKLDEHASRTESLLQLEYGKLESDFNFISIWGAVITIVFLVFSIYSMFKVDQLQSQSQDSYNKIAEFHTNALNLSTEIDRELKKTKDKITQETDDSISLIRKKTHDAIDEQSESIKKDFNNRFNEQMAQVDRLTSLVETATQTIKDLSESLKIISVCQEEGNSKDESMNPSDLETSEEKK